MKTFSIGKYAKRDRAATYTNCSEAFVSNSASHGFRVTGFDREGRRWSITIDERLIDDLVALRTRPAVRP